MSFSKQGKSSEPEDWNKYLFYRNGSLYWKSRDIDEFEDIRSCNSWHGKNFGKEAGTAAVKCNGAIYRRLTFRNRSFFAHRVIWEMHFGGIPKGMQVDHIDGNPSNNDIKNLRLVTNSGNSRNRKISPRNTSGVPGVHLIRKTDKWNVRLKVNGKNLFFGNYDDRFEAICARKSAEMRHGFHVNHGRR